MDLHPSSLKIVGRIQFPMVLALKSLFPCWLSATGGSQRPKVLTIPDPWPSTCTYKTSNGRSSPSHASNLPDLPFCLISLLPPSSVFKGSCDYIGSIQIIQESLPVLKSDD